MTQPPHGFVAALALCLLGIASLVPATPAAAQQRPIKIIVPYAPGGPIDTTVRLLADRVKESPGTVIVENKPGASGDIGADAVARRRPMA